MERNDMTRLGKTGGGTTDTRASYMAMQFRERTFSLLVGLMVIAFLAKPTRADRPERSEAARFLIARGAQITPDYTSNTEAVVEFDARWKGTDADLAKVGELDATWMEI